MSNLPPGCRVSDIPGNRSEDQKHEAEWEEFYDKVYEESYQNVTDAKAIWESGKRAIKWATDEGNTISNALNALEVVNAFIVKIAKGFNDQQPKSTD